MTATANAAGPEQGRRGFSLPSAYTILFLLIVIVALLTWIIPAGAVRRRSGRRADPGHVPHASRRTRSGSSSIR